MHMIFGLSTKFVCEVHVSADRERDGPGSISRVTGRVDSAVAVGKGHVEKRGRGWFDQPTPLQITNNTFTSIKVTLAKEELPTLEPANTNSVLLNIAMRAPDIFSLKQESSIFRSVIQPCMWFLNDRTG